MLIFQNGLKALTAGYNNIFISVKKGEIS